jgi:hypothetical protein
MDLVTAWRTNEAWRDDFVFWAARDLSKTGDLGAHDQVLQELAASLYREEVLWFYAQLQKSRRPTTEWQAEFLRLFPQVTRGDLPPSIIDEEKAAREAEAQRAADEARYEPKLSHGPWPDPDGPIPF